MLRTLGTRLLARQQAWHPAARLGAGFATDQDFSLALKQAEEVASASVPSPPGECGATYGVPLETFQRKAMIHMPARTAGQQGGGNSIEQANSPLWKITFDNTNKWINPLMGWSSTADPLENVGRTSLSFPTKEHAMAFCRKSGWEFEVVEPNQHLISRPRRFNAYGDNFSTRRGGVPDLSTQPSNRGFGTPSTGSSTAKPKAAAK